MFGNKFHRVGFPEWHQPVVVLEDPSAVKQRQRERREVLHPFLEPPDAGPLGIVDLIVDLILPEAEHGHEISAVLQRQLDEALSPDQVQLDFVLSADVE